MALDISAMGLSFVEAGSGVPLVLLHGFPHNRSLWEPQLAELSRDCRVITPDLRGFGESQGQPPHTMDAHADDVVELLDQLRIERAVICGLSMGGYVAFALHRRHRARMRALILADTRAGADSDETRHKRRETQALARAQGAGAVADSQITGMLGATTRELRPDVVRQVHSILSGAPVEGIVAALEAMMGREDSTPLLPQIDIPVLILVGEEDALTPVKESRAMHQSIEGSRLEIIPRAGHLSNLENPTEFNRAVSDFITSLGSEAGG